jgi:nucleoid DNA-binding protein
MTKKELSTQVANELGITSAQVEAIINASIQVAKKTVAKGEAIYIRGFGTLAPKQRRSKIGRNINKGTTVFIPERTVPAFKPSVDFTKSLN